MRNRSAFPAIAVLILTAACASAGGRAARGWGRAAGVPVDSLAPLLRAHFGLPPVVIDVWTGRRVAVGLTGAPWADSAAAVRFDRAYDVARVVWDRYGAAAGVDTVSVREVTTPETASAGSGAWAGRSAAEYVFVPRQLTARTRPRRPAQ